MGLERNAINVTSVVGEVGSHFDFRQHFLSVGELLSPSLWLDWGASEPAYRFNLGIAQWVPGGLGMAFAVWRTIRREWAKAAEPLFYAIAALLLVGLMLPLSTAVWEAIPLLPFIQFPWRLLGPAASLLAVLAGYAIYEVEDFCRGRACPDPQLAVGINWGRLAPTSLRWHLLCSSPSRSPKPRRGQPILAKLRWRISPN
ncbi:MAG: hypothetical protein IPL28_02485 [Chloroflexi bacterium]|nr:hypothetical protein [Chloroflexota bacterium]